MGFNCVYTSLKNSLSGDYFIWLRFIYGKSSVNEPGSVTISSTCEIDSEESPPDYMTFLFLVIWRDIYTSLHNGCTYWHFYSEGGDISFLYTYTIAFIYIII